MDRGGTFDAWDWPATIVDALNGDGVIDKGQPNSSPLTIGIANAAGVQQRLQNSSGTTTIIKSGTGLKVFSGNNSYSGTTSVNGGTLQVGAGGNSGSLGTGSVTDNAVLASAGGDSGFTMAVAISGTGSVAQIGSGLTTLTANNSYGATTITGGTLQLGSGGATGTAGTGNVTFANNSASRSVAIGAEHRRQYQRQRQRDTRRGQ